MKIITISILILFFSGCSYLPTIEAGLIKIHDNELSIAEKAFCGGVTDSAVYRRYGLNSPKAIARRVVCGYAGEGSTAR